MLNNEMLGGVWFVLWLVLFFFAGGGRKSLTSDTCDTFWKF